MEVNAHTPRELEISPAPYKIPDMNAPVQLTTQPILLKMCVTTDVAIFSTALNKRCPEAEWLTPITI